MGISSARSRLIIVGLVVVAGLTFAAASRAAQVAVTTEPEQGSIGAPAVKLADSSASGGSAIKFGPAGPAATGITYGTDGNGDPSTAGCTTYVEPSQAVSTVVANAGAGGVVCVKASNRPTETIAVNRSDITVRATGKTTIRSATLTGSNITLSGFTVIGGAFDNPSAGVAVNGRGIKVLNNLINGKELRYGIYCDRRSECSGNVYAGNTITGLQSIGIYLGGGDGAVVEKNNVYDLVRTRPDYDVDAMRFFGINHQIRFNYFHDINMYKSVKNASGDTPHTDCFQTYQTYLDYNTMSGPIEVGNVTVENNYCVRVSRQCLIAENNVQSTYLVHDITFRNNVCETYDSQVVTLKGIKNFKAYNNALYGGYRFQIVATLPGKDDLANTGLVFRNNVLVRPRTTANFFAGSSPGNIIRENNLELTDTSIAGRDQELYDSLGPLPALRAEDFVGYRNAMSSRTVRDAGIAGNTATLDVSGAPRVSGARIDIGPYEF